MFQITVGIDGMMCGMCEAHMNEAFRKHIDVKKVTSSHAKKQSVIITEEDAKEEDVRKIVADTGYTVTSFEKVPYKKKGLFGLFGK